MPPMLREWLFTFMNDLSRCGVYDNFMVKVVTTVYDTTEIHPFACFAMKVIT
jgi:hypothetical protein